MKKEIAVLSTVGIFTFSTQSIFANTYEVPPSSTTTGSVPWISDMAMEQCVIFYNEAEWLSDEIGRTQVDRYSQTAVDNYNTKVDRESLMTNIFNRDCAGKQSESAYKAAQKLNNKNKIIKEG